MYRLVFIVACLSVALAQYEHFPTNSPDGRANPYNDTLNSPVKLSDILQQYREYDEDDDVSSTRSPEHPTSSKPYPEVTERPSNCPRSISAYPRDITKFILGGLKMSCPDKTFFDPSICVCQHIALLPR